MKSFKLAQTALAVLAFGAGVAQASPIVTTWGVTDTANFVAATVQPSGNLFPNPVLSNGDTQLHWGNANPQSGLIISNSGVEVPVPTGTLTPTVSVTHDNFVIPLGNSLTSVDILASLSLRSLLPGVGPTNNAATTFTIRFLETPNGGTGGFCADGAPVGSGGVNANGCADIFVLSNNALNFPFLYDSDGAVNGFDPEPYFVSFFANGLGTLSNAACASAGAANGCRGFETAEGQSTTANFQILITSTPFNVPEPGSMALVGGALAALALGRRRKQSD